MELSEKIATQLIESGLSQADLNKLKDFIQTILDEDEFPNQ